MSTTGATHGCTAVPCTICGSGSSMEFGPWMPSVRFIPPATEWLPFTHREPPEPTRVELLVCPCNTWSDFPQPCGIHGQPAHGVNTYSVSSGSITTYRSPRAPFADGVIPQIGWRK